jgi:hypothetical protein
MPKTYICVFYEMTRIEVDVEAETVYDSGTQEEIPHG